MTNSRCHHGKNNNMILTFSRGEQCRKCQRLLRKLGAILLNTWMKNSSPRYRFNLPLPKTGHRSPKIGKSWTTKRTSSSYSKDFVVNLLLILGIFNSSNFPNDSTVVSLFSSSNITICSQFFPIFHPIQLRNPKFCCKHRDSTRIGSTLKDVRSSWKV